jgi:hypothetical protein
MNWSGAGRVALTSWSAQSSLCACCLEAGLPAVQ